MHLRIYQGKKSLLIQKGTCGQDCSQFSFCHALPPPIHWSYQSSLLMLSSSKYIKEEFPNLLIFIQIFHSTHPSYVTRWAVTTSRYPPLFLYKHMAHYDQWITQLEECQRQKWKTIEDQNMTRISFMNDKLTEKWIR